MSRDTDRIALISDIHGNLPALEAVLGDIARRGIGRVICLGDLAGKGPDGACVIDICRERCEAVILGNWDAVLAGDHPTLQWYRDKAGPERCAWLGSLPFSLDLALGTMQVRLVHASPQGIYHRVHQDAPWPELHGMFANTEHTDDAVEPDLVAYGDIHAAYVRCFDQRT